MPAGGKRVVERTSELILANERLAGNGTAAAGTPSARDIAHRRP